MCCESTIFSMDAFMQEGIEAALKELNIEYDTFYYTMKDWDNDSELESSLDRYIAVSKNVYDCVFQLISRRLSRTCVID